MTVKAEDRPVDSDYGEGVMPPVESTVDDHVVYRIVDPDFNVEEFRAARAGRYEDVHVVVQAVA